MITYKGYYNPQNKEKYQGSLPIIYRSSWELSLMIWCDKNANILEWKSESIIIPYYNEIDKKYHKYYIDFSIKFKNNETYLIEIKPEKQTIAPIKCKSGKITKKYLMEVLEYNKNCSKWIAAKKFAEEKGYNFQIWTENTLKHLGIKLL